MKERSKDIIRSDFKEMAPDFKVIIIKFYERLFEVNPEYRKIFKNDIDAQANKFIHMLGLGVRGLDNEAELAPALKFLGKNHRSYGVSEEDYPVVRDALLYSFRNYLGDRFTPESEESWKEFYDHISGIMIEGAKN